MYIFVEIMKYTLVHKWTVSAVKRVDVVRIKGEFPYSFKIKYIK